MYYTSTAVSVCRMYVRCAMLHRQMLRRYSRQSGVACSRAGRSGSSRGGLLCLACDALNWHVLYTVRTSRAAVLPRGVTSCACTHDPSLPRLRTFHASFHIIRSLVPKCCLYQHSRQVITPVPPFEPRAVPLIVRPLV